MPSIHSSNRNVNVEPNSTSNETSNEKYNEINERILNSLMGGKGGGKGGNGGGSGVSIATSFGSAVTLKSCLLSSSLRSRSPKLSRINSRNSFSKTGSESGCGMRRNVSFNSITIRDYDPCVGDNPSVSKGVPISIDWEYEEQEAMDLERYETSRDGQRRERGEMRIPSFVRRDVLKNNGFSNYEIQTATKDASITRKQRHNTRNQKPVMEKTSLVIEKISRNIRRVVSINSMGKELEDMLQRANSSKESLAAANKKYLSLPKSQSVDQFGSHNRYNNSNNGESKQNVTWDNHASRNKITSRGEIQQQINLLDLKIRKRVSLGLGNGVEKVHNIQQRSHSFNNTQYDNNNNNGGTKQNATWNNNIVSNKRISNNTRAHIVNSVDQKIINNLNQKMQMNLSLDSSCATSSVDPIVDRPTSTNTSAAIAAAADPPPPRLHSSIINIRVQQLRGFQSCTSLSNHNAANGTPLMPSQKQKPQGGYGRRSYTMSRSSNSLSILKTITEQTSSSSRPPQQSNNNAGGNVNATWNTNTSSNRMNNKRAIGSYVPGLESKLSRHKLNIVVENGGIGGRNGNASWNTNNKTMNANLSASNRNMLGLTKGNLSSQLTQGNLSAQLKLQQGASLLAQLKKESGAGISAASLLAQHNKERLAFKVAGQSSSSRISNLQNAIMANALQSSNAAQQQN